MKENVSPNAIAGTSKNEKAEQAGQLILDGTKLLWHQERIKAWQAGERIAPLTIDCALTSSCTYGCRYCYGQLQRMGSKPLPKDTVLNFLSDAAEIGVKAVSLVSDGESTCSPHLVDAILHGKAEGLDMALGTNGYLLHDEDLSCILPALTYLRFNISSGTAGGYAHIHGVQEKHYNKVLNTIRKAVEIKKREQLSVTLGLQMVLMPEYAHDILPLARLGRELGVDYLVIKHCSDDENGQLGVDYAKYHALTNLLHEAEALSTPEYLVQAKWSKIMSGGTRCYSKCFGPAFMLQLSGSGLVAPCGMLFNDRYKEFHMGSILEQSFRKIWESDRYWDVLRKISSPGFDARTDCGTLCLQHKINEVLWQINATPSAGLPLPQGEQPDHLNFI